MRALPWRAVIVLFVVNSCGITPVRGGTAGIAASASSGQKPAMVAPAPAISAPSYKPPRMPLQGVTSRKQLGYDSSRQLWGYRQLGFYQLNGTWVYQSGSMKYPVVVLQMPQIQVGWDNRITVITPARVGGRYNKR